VGQSCVTNRTFLPTAKRQFKSLKADIIGHRDELSSFETLLTFLKSGRSLASDSSQTDWITTDRCIGRKAGEYKEWKRHEKLMREICSFKSFQVPVRDMPLNNWRAGAKYPFEGDQGSGNAKDDHECCDCGIFLIECLNCEALSGCENQKIYREEICDQGRPKTKVKAVMLGFPKLGA
jgi:hypothetical protein